MTNIPFSKTGLLTVPDPMADIFRRGRAGAVAYRETTGKELISLAVGTPDPALLPARVYLELAQEIVNTVGPGTLNYTMPQGLPPLRETFHKYLSTAGIVCSADDLLVTSGGMEALSLGAWMLVNPGDTVIAEGPGFAGALSIFEILGAKIIQIPCDAEGIDVTALEAAMRAHKPALVSLMPDYQNPSGAVMPLGHRQQIADLLKKYDTFALEDGAYSALRFEGEPLPPLQALAPERVVYSTSVSKILAPAMRVGALVAPRTLADRAADCKSAFNMQASAINQSITSFFIGDHRGYLQKHLAKLRTTYRKRRNAMVAALQASFPEKSGFGWTCPGGGMFLWLSGPPAVDFEALFDAAVRHGVSYVPGNVFYAQNPGAPRNHARLNFASTPEDGIREGVRRLAEVVKK